MHVCVHVLLMSSAAVNDSIRLFLNALVTPMGHSARESAQSAERAQALAGHQRHTYTLRHTYTHRCTRMIHTDNQWCALTYPFVCLFTISLACVSCWQSNNMREAESLGEKYEICHCNAADYQNEIFIPQQQQIRYKSSLKASCSRMLVILYNTFAHWLN